VQSETLKPFLKILEGHKNSQEYNKALCKFVKHSIAWYSDLFPVAYDSKPHEVV